MQNKSDVVITGVGVISPIGIGADAFWHALLEGGEWHTTYRSF